MKINLKFQSNLIFPISVLVFPIILGLLLPFGIGFKFNVFYFSLISIFSFIVIPTQVIRKRYSTSEVSIIMLSILLLLFSIINYTSASNSMPILYFFVVSSCTLLKFDGQIKKISKYCLIVFVLYILLAIIYSFFSTSFALEGRFSGFTGSSTTFSMFIILIVTINILLIKKKLYRVILYTIGLVLILPTVTRLNIAFYLFLPFFLFFAKKNRLIRLVVLLIYMTLLNLTYPVYNSIIKNYPSLVEVRYESGRDASFGLRYALFNKTLEKFSELTTNEKLLGAGNEASRNMIKANFKSDLQTHNDFIRFLFDFGIIPTLMFLTFLLIIFSKNKATFMIGLIYLVSFYHNMLYQLIFILLAIYFFKIKLNEN